MARLGKHGIQILMGVSLAVMIFLQGYARTHAQHVYKVQSPRPISSVAVLH